jgi:hypothetical protein
VTERYRVALAFKLWLIEWSPVAELAEGDADEDVDGVADMENVC